MTMFATADGHNDIVFTNVPDAVFIVDGGTIRHEPSCGVKMGVSWGPELSTTDDGLDTICSGTAVRAAGCRCCGVKPTSICDHDCQTHTFEECERKCVERGSRLCSASEVLAGIVEGTGCWYDTMHVWTSTTCTARPSRLFSLPSDGPSLGQPLKGPARSLPASVVWTPGWAQSFFLLAMGLLGIQFFWAVIRRRPPSLQGSRPGLPSGGWCLAGRCWHHPDRPESAPLVIPLGELSA